MKLSGYRYFNYTQKNTGNVVRGCELYVTDAPRKDVVGIWCDKVFVRADKVENELSLLTLPADINLLYNRFGGVERIELL